jgi:hypothetical protein
MSFGGRAPVSPGVVFVGWGEAFQALQKQVNRNGFGR